MNNFYKPSYSRGQKRSVVQSRQSGSKNMKRDNKIFADQKIRQQIGNLDPDHNILLHRRNVFTAQNFQQQTQQQLIKTSNLPKKQPTRFNQTAKEGFRKNVQRPQSKQQPRVKGWNTSGLLLKSTLPQTNRPRTSKGQRPKLSYKQKFDDISKRRTSLQNDDFKIFRISNEIEKKKRQIPNSSASSRKGSQSNRIQFKTSIDPQFLSLFAN